MRGLPTRISSFGHEDAFIPTNGAPQGTFDTVSCEKHPGGSTTIHLWEAKAGCQGARDSKVLGNKFSKNGSLAQRGSAEYALELLGSDPEVAAAIEHVGVIDGSRVHVAHHMVRSFPDGTVRQVDFEMSTANGHLRESQMK